MNIYKQITSQFGKQHIFHRGCFGNENYILRLADHNDYKDVLDISKQTKFYYPGMDYVPAMYHWMLDIGHMIIVLMVINNRPIAFGIFYILDPDGEEVFEFGSRVIPEYRSKGVYALLGSFTLNFLRTQVPTLLRQLNTGVMVAGRKEFQQYHKAVQLLSATHLIFHTSSLAMRTKAKFVDSTIAVQQVLPHQVASIFQDQRNLKVFKQKVFCVDSAWFPYKVNIQNIMKAAQRHLVFVSYDKNDVITGVTFACSLNAPSGLLFDIYYYGEVNTDVYIQHMLTAMGKLSQNQKVVKENEKVIFTLHFPEEIPAAKVEAFILDNKIGDKKINSKPVQNKTNIVSIEIDSLLCYMKTDQSKL